MEQVNHPKHYNADGKKECIEEMRDMYGSNKVGTFCLLSAYKYLYRAGEKQGNPKEQDMAKAEWYVSYFERECINDLIDDARMRYLYRDVCKEMRRANDKD